MSNRGEIEIGEYCLVSWNTWICDKSFHRILSLNAESAEISKRQSEIGNHVWMCANSSIQRGALVPQNCVIAIESLVLGGIDEPNCLIAGIPAKIKKSHLLGIVINNERHK